MESKQKLTNQSAEKKTVKIPKTHQVWFFTQTKNPKKPNNIQKPTGLSFLKIVFLQEPCDPEPSSSSTAFHCKPKTRILQRKGGSDSTIKWPFINPARRSGTAVSSLCTVHGPALIKAPNFYRKK